MIHQVNRLPLANRLLPDVIALQVATMEAAGRNDVTQEIVMNPALFTPILQTHLDTKRRFRGRGEAIAKWIMTGRKGVRKTLVEPLSKFANSQPREKTQFITDAKNDIWLLYRPSETTLKVAILKDEPNEWRIGARDFLCEFYDLWQLGFPEFVFSSTRQRYSHQKFVQEFEKVNSDLYLCAICDGSAYHTKTESHIYTSIDHFFPRSIYPHLSCHPLNLIPICSFCNSYIKGKKDPLVLNGQHLHLADLVLPYQKCGTAFRDQTYISVLKRDTRINRLQHPLRLELKPARDFQLGKKIDAFNNIYKVEERWSENLHEIEDQIFRRITQFLSLVDPVKLTSEPSALNRYLKVLMSQIDLGNLGKEPYAFPFVWLLNSYISQIQDQKEDAPVFKALRNWVSDNQQRWSQLEEHSEKIFQRLPDPGTDK